MNKQSLRQLRHRRVRARVIGKHDKPRLNVFRSLNHIYVQLIDDEAGKTLAAASSKEIKTKAKKLDLAAGVGKLVAERALKLGIKKVVFDRGGYQYHGRIKQLADAARVAGLEF
ncbi:MAG: 50S ribosomal protein L18 [Candidatus Doudnabacteria bacterium RIFCSPLOWO2_01_FULL_44_21]|uniref:Large ribosomal subunit protein uL18 n=1 Tax=Candidatus Doudnabacteria bacterium RIFCSPLOWO2_01_FULL_44_21 TaxID=1817841 RepID=A0A1F5PY62_9BACT|nr:ribosomal protein L18 [uncultured bacterium]OGE83560.1 MAG: 50S ribosomal protein L18 [Candidatus Doudnabacteria bacterium RIFCSPHIGHO2_02_FULL_43_13b]OGE94794.1 MAG: 50S ribosomal protein L18 [Candidatus Doudnabacteria bacterium RIFCSPLOWO2_01_FULL_44_21]